MSYSGRKILVTGGTGFVGGRLAERLVLEENARVRVMVRDWCKATWVSRADVEFAEGNVTDPDAVARAVKGCEVVFHCVGVGGSLKRCMAVNVEGTRNVLSSARDEKVERIVCLSTIGVHGPAPPDNACESDDFRFTGAPYGDSKIAAEEEVWEFRKRHRLPVSVIRPTFVWGPRSEYFSKWPVRCIGDGRWFLVDGGRGTCHAVHVDNLVDAILLAGKKEEAVGEAFIITDDQPCTWAEFFMSYARMVGKDDLPSVSSRSVPGRVLRLPARLLDGMMTKLSSTPSREPARFLVRGTRFSLRRIRGTLDRYVPFDAWETAKYARVGGLDTSKARNLLGYQPSVSREEGMRQTELWLRDQGFI